MSTSTTPCNLSETFPICNMNSFILYPPALEKHAAHEGISNLLRHCNMGFEFGFNPSFLMPGHGKKINSELTKSDGWRALLPICKDGATKVVHLTLAISGSLDGMSVCKGCGFARMMTGAAAGSKSKSKMDLKSKTGSKTGPKTESKAVSKTEADEEFTACLVAAWYNCNNPRLPMVFVSMAKVDRKHTAFLFYLLVEMIRYLWLTKAKDEEFPALKEASRVMVAVHRTVIDGECASELLKLGFVPNAESGLLIAMLERDA